MDKNVRKGARRDRNQKWATRVPDLGYYLVVTDTQETEKNYFSGLRDSIPEAKIKKLEEDGKVKPSEMWPGNMVYKLVKELTDKIIH